MGLAAFGPVDRRVDTPVHPADLVSHELATNRENTQIIEALGQRLTILDVTPDHIRGVLDDFTEIWQRVKRDRIRRKNELKRTRK
jgi:hypothetical protein